MISTSRVFRLRPLGLVAASLVAILISSTTAQADLLVYDPFGVSGGPGDYLIGNEDSGDNVLASQNPLPSPTPFYSSPWIQGGGDSQAVKAGSKFIVSPGLTTSLISAAAASEVPLLPGTITPGEIMTALEAGIDFLKFFPAEQAGGTTFLRSLASPLAAARFCPTGGIDMEKAKTYLALPNVICVGGSWVMPADAIASGDWKRIEKLAREAAALKKAA